MGVLWYSQLVTTAHPILHPPLTLMWGDKQGKPENRIYLSRAHTYYHTHSYRSTSMITIKHSSKTTKFTLTLHIEDMVKMYVTTSDDTLQGLLMETMVQSLDPTETLRDYGRDVYGHINDLISEAYSKNN